MLDSMLTYETDEEGNEVLLKEGRHQVMMAWEKPYMEACIRALSPRGSVLEIGYGLGYSARAIQEFKPKKHTIIECDETVLHKAKEFSGLHKNVEIIQGTWQETLPSLGEFDAIFFDDYPLDSEELIPQKDTPNLEAIPTGEKPSHFSEKDLCEFLDHIHIFPKAEEYLHRFIQDSIASKLLSPDEAKQLQSLAKERGLEIKAFTLPKSSPRSDRFYQFLFPALESHLKVGGAFSCYQEYSQSKYEDQYFTNAIILNPSLEYHEEWVAVSPPKHCEYFEGNKALVMLIKKNAPVKF